jgi:hypothetical protein
MKIIQSCNTPYLFAHGGMQVQIDRTRTALQALGLDVEPLRWWDVDQTGDILHHFGYLPVGLVQLARRKGFKVIITAPLSETCNRASLQLLIRGLLVRGLPALPLPKYLKLRLPGQSYLYCDQIVVGLEAERKALGIIYGVPDSLVSIVHLGLAEPFLKSGAAPRRANHLVCTGTIAPVKNSVELARLAHAARAPILFVGKPYDFDSAYWKEFQSLIDNQWVKYQPHVKTELEMAVLLRDARGFVLMSRYENWCLAAHEAVACGLPLLLPAQKWSRERFGSQASYFPASRSHAIKALQEFYQRCPELSAPRIELFGWLDVARSLRTIYERVLQG